MSASRRVRYITVAFLTLIPAPLVSGQHEQTTDGLVTAFEKQTGITVNVRNDDEGTLANLIAVQGSHTPADVFYTENSPALEFLQEKGLLAPVEEATLSHTPAQYNSPQGDWVGVSARVSVIVYNPSLIPASQLPASVMQLADPKYQGKLALAPSETDFQPIVTSVTRTYGKSAALGWLGKVKANAASHVVPDNETLVDEVNRGQVAFGVVNQYYWYRLGAEIGTSAMHSQITHFAPRDPGYVVDVSGAVTHDQDEALSTADRVAVLRDGTIAQYAPPEALYRRPADPGLARFVGEANLLSGVVRGPAVETPLGTLPLDPAAPGLGAAGQVTVLIRPEQIDMMPNGPDITARVISYRYHGHDAVVDVLPGDETGAPSIVVRVAGGSPHLAGSAVGLRVRGPVFAWPAD